MASRKMDEHEMQFDARSAWSTKQCLEFVIALCLWAVVLGNVLERYYPAMGRSFFSDIPYKSDLTPPPTKPQPKFQPHRYASVWFLFWLQYHVALSVNHVQDKPHGYKTKVKITPSTAFVVSSIEPKRSRGVSQSYPVGSAAG